MGKRYVNTGLALCVRVAKAFVNAFKKKAAEHRFEKPKHPCTKEGWAFGGQFKIDKVTLKSTRVDSPYRLGR